MNRAKDSTFKSTQQKNWKKLQINIKKGINKNRKTWKKWNSIEKLKRRKKNIQGIWVRAANLWVHWVPQGDAHCWGIMSPISFIFLFNVSLVFSSKNPFNNNKKLSKLMISTLKLILLKKLNLTWPKVKQRWRGKETFEEDKKEGN